MSDETDWEQFYKRLESENAELRRQNAELSAACKARDGALNNADALVDYVAPLVEAMKEFQRLSVCACADAPQYHHNCRRHERAIADKALSDWEARRAAWRAALAWRKSL